MLKRLFMTASVVAMFVGVVGCAGGGSGLIVHDNGSVGPVRYPTVELNNPSQYDVEVTVKYYDSNSGNAIDSNQYSIAAYSSKTVRMKPSDDATMGVMWLGCITADSADQCADGFRIALYQNNDVSFTFSADKFERRSKKSKKSSDD